MNSYEQCFVMSSTSNYEFLHTQSVLIDFNEPLQLVVQPLSSSVHCKLWML